MRKRFTVAIRLKRISHTLNIVGRYNSNPVDLREVFIGGRPPVTQHSGRVVM